MITQARGDQEMKPAKACWQCRSSKRKCVLAEESQTACFTCRNRKIQCSNATKPANPHRSIASSAAQIQEQPLAPESKEDIIEFVELYLRFIHDRPHSLFHESTLRTEVRAGTLSECLLWAICALGCRFSPDEANRLHATRYRKNSSSLFANQLEFISLSNVQTCILLANLYAAEQDNGLEALYFGIANRMAYVLRLHQEHPEDPPVLREVKCRVWWSLFMADRWCPPGLGLPREIQSSGLSVDAPMNEANFQRMESTAQTMPQARIDGIWKYKITLVDILGSIQDMNLSLVQSNCDRFANEQQVLHLAERLRSWRDSLPQHMLMNDGNLDLYRNKGHGGTFVALHFGYHHYSTLLYFQYLEAAAEPLLGTTLYADECRYHALAFSRLLRKARAKGDCHVVYLTVAHMTMVSSSVLLHMLLFGNEQDIAIARSELTSNFDALIELKKYWPHMDRITQRLLTFQEACLRSSNHKAYALDGWMLRFLMEYGLPLEHKHVEDNDQTNMSRPLTTGNPGPMERRNTMTDAWAQLRM